MNEHQQETLRRAKVMMAFAEGKKILSCLRNHTTEWANNPAPIWDWRTYDYKVAPETVKVWLISTPNDNKLYPVLEAEAVRLTGGGGISAWVARSDMIEIEVKDVPTVP